MGRIYTLAVHILIRSSYDIFTPIMDSTAWFNADVLKWWTIANLGLHVVYLVYWFFNLRNKDYKLKHSEETILVAA
jgi:arginyl-tRNA--protein-N-Asp/Glu arginylyltransferase